MGVSDDKFIPGLNAPPSRVHRHGAKVAIQLQHARQDLGARPRRGPRAVGAVDAAAPQDRHDAGPTREELGFISSSKEGRERPA